MRFSPGPTSKQLRPYIIPYCSKLECLSLSDMATPGAYPWTGVTQVALLG